MSARPAHAPALAPAGRIGQAETRIHLDYGAGMSRSFLCSGAIALSLFASACTDKGPSDEGADDSVAMTTEPGDGSESDSAESESGTPADPGWFEVGWGVDSFTPIVDGDEFTIVTGTQGASMFPMPIRGGEFVLPDDPSDYLDERAPMMDLELDIEGFNDGFGGHFKRIANYPLVFEILPDGTYEFLYVAIILPDGQDAFELEGLPAHLRVQIRPYESDPIVRELDLVVAVEPPPL